MKRSGGLLLLLFLGTFLTADAGPSTIGSEFHFLFGPNLFALGKAYTRILVTTSESEPVNFWVLWNKTVTSPKAKSNTTHTVSRGRVEIIDIPHALSINKANPRTPDIGIQLRSQDGKQLTVVAVNEKVATTDAYLVFPKIETKSKTYEYFALSVNRGPFSNIKSFFGFVTTEPNSTITITPVTTMTTWFVGFHLLLRGRNYTGTVSAAGTSIAAVATRDLSGTRIVSDKPLSFITGHECGNLPTYSFACDHMVEQVPPTETWGFKFFLVPLSTRSGDGYRILASRGGTECNIMCTDPSLSETITLTNPGDFKELIYTTRYCCVECTRPVLIFQISLGSSYDSITRSDPFAVMIPPVRQYSNDYDLIFFESKELDSRGQPVVFEAWINIAIPAEHDPSGLRFDGSPISGVTFVNVSCSDGEVCGKVAQYKPTSDNGSHKLQHVDPNARFVAIVYGWARLNTYGYIGGMKFDSVDVESFCFKKNASSTSESNKSAPFVVTRSGTATDNRPSCIMYTLGDISTQGIGDYANTSGECCFEAGETETTCEIELVVDSVSEPNEVLRIELAPSLGQSVCEGQGKYMEITIVEELENKSQNVFTVHSNPADPVIMEAETPDGDKVLLVGTKNSSGAPRKVDFFHIVSKDGNVTDVHLGDDGTPVRAVSEDGARIDFTWGDNYTSVHLAAVTSDGTSQVNINIDLSDTSSRRKREVNELVNHPRDNPMYIQSRHRRQDDSMDAMVTVNVTSCGVPECDAQVGAEVSVGYNNETRRYNSVTQVFGEKTDTEGIFKVTIPIQPASESATACKQVEESIKNTCEWYRTQQKPDEQERSQGIFIICLALNGALPESRRGGPLSTLCQNSFKGFEVFCGDPDKPDGVDTGKSNRGAVCDEVTHVLDSALGAHEGSTILFRPYAVFENGGKVYADGKMLELVPGTIGSCVIENPSTTPTVHNLVVEPLDPAPSQDYVVNITYTCTTATVSVTMDIVGTDGYTKTVNCVGGTTCTLPVPGAAALVEDTVTVSIRDDPDFNFRRVVLIIF